MVHLETCSKWGSPWLTLVVYSVCYTLVAGGYMCGLPHLEYSVIVYGLIWAQTLGLDALFVGGFIMILLLGLILAASLSCIYVIYVCFCQFF